MSLVATVPSSRLSRGPFIAIQKGITVDDAVDTKILDLNLTNTTDNSRYLRVRITNKGAVALDGLDLVTYVHPDGNPVTIADAGLNAPTVGFPSSRLTWSSGSNLHQLAASATAELVIDVTGLTRVVMFAQSNAADVTVDVELGLT
jgi:hypothetical protein